MTTRLLSLVLVAALSSTLAAQNADLQVIPTLQGGLTVVDIQVSGPAFSNFILYIAPLGLSEPIDVLAQGNLGPTGLWRLSIPLQGQFLLPNVWLGGFVMPIGGPPVFAGMAGAAVAAGPGPAVPVACPSSGAMAIHENPCMVILRGKVCPPGAIVQIFKNGVPVIGGNAAANGDITLAAGGVCLAPGDTLTATVNGAPWLGPITR